MTATIVSLALLLTPSPIAAPKEAHTWVKPADVTTVVSSQPISSFDYSTLPVSESTALFAATVSTAVIEPPPEPHPKWLTEALLTPGLSDRQLDRLGYCESTNNYRIDTGNGFYGRVQWLRSTWDAVARRLGAWDYVGLKPSLAEPVVQDGFTKWWWANSSPRQQWPVCSQRIGAA